MTDEWIWRQAMTAARLPRNDQLKKYASELRTNATKQENHLWYDFLRNYPIRFKRQYIIGSYIADFYCANAKLVVELDGGQHYEENGLVLNDLVRSEYFESLGLKVLRFTNTELMKQFESVCMTINMVVKERL
jgi:very-short-patch-repair endonuclease